MFLPKNKRETVMKKILFLATALMLNPLFAQKNDLAVSTQIATQMYEDGVVDDSRIFIFEYSYGPGYCDVTSITVNNKNCSREEMGGNKGFWLKPEYASRETHGNKFTCKLSKINSDSYELVVDEPVGVSGKIIHRLILQDKKILMQKIKDFSAVLTKFSNITNKTETVTYKPIIKSGYNNWVGIDVGCKSMVVPVLTKWNY